MAVVVSRQATFARPRTMRVYATRRSLFPDVAPLDTVTVVGKSDKAPPLVPMSLHTRYRVLFVRARTDAGFSV